MSNQALASMDGWCCAHCARSWGDFKITNAPGPALKAACSVMFTEETCFAICTCVPKVRGD
jgi:hypothetical protein